jgi:hypothetical protein
MADRMVSGTLFVLLSAIFGGYAMGALFAAYRAGNRTVWIEKAVQGGFGMIVSFLFADLVAHLLG